MPKLHQRLALSAYVGSLLGDERDTLGAALREVQEGTAPSGQSNFYESIRGRRGLRLEDGALQRYDTNILAHEGTLQRHRPGFRLRYFQYLAVLYTEILLDRLATDPGALLRDVEAYRAEHFDDLPEYTAAALRTLAFWMATGAGKTLLMHVNLLQALHYFPNRFRNVLLLVPNETLRSQHLEELAESGIDAGFALDPDAIRAKVQVLEISKLYVDDDAASRPRGQLAVSRPTSEFEGPTLLLVDEGHKGTRTRSEVENERAWRNIRESLAGANGPKAQAGLTLEYSATFAQVTEGRNVDAQRLFDDYARQTLYEYAYRRFHGDGFGKDYRVINVKQDISLYGDLLLLGALLTFYEKQRIFDEQLTVATSFRAAPPLMTFVSAYVTGGPELIDVLSFIDRVLADSTWTQRGVEELLRGTSGLPDADMGEVFAMSFQYLKKLGLSANLLVEDIYQRLFYGSGRLALAELSDAPGEIGLRTLDARKDKFFGLINVGDAAKLIKKVKADTSITVLAEAPFTGSLFETIGEDTSELRFLIGSKKFSEGWSTPRVSVMGLMKVGSSAGAQVLQLFGRGVRLRGHGGLMRRAYASGLGSVPPFVERLETLDIFGVKANYLKTFLETLRREDVDIPTLRAFPLFPNVEAFEEAGLRTLSVPSSYRFEDADSCVFDPKQLRSSVSVDLMPKLVVGTAERVVDAGGGNNMKPLPESAINIIDTEALYYHALAVKRQKDWRNLSITRESIAITLADKCRIASPDEILDPHNKRQLATLQTASETLIEKALSMFYRGARARAEQEMMQTVDLTLEDPNLPRVTLPPATKGVAPAQRYGYELKVPPALLAQVDKLLADLEPLRDEASAVPLPRMNVVAHLYQPLLTAAPFRVQQGTLFFDEPLDGTLGVRASPPGLVESEASFLHDLRTTWEGSAGEIAPGAELYVLRNISGRGVGFYDREGFYPDFMIWMKSAQAQVLAFVDPKGLVIYPEEKVEMLATIEARSEVLGFPILARILSRTPVDKVSFAGVSDKDKDVFLRDKGVLFMEDRDYVEILLKTMFERLVGLSD